MVLQKAVVDLFPEYQLFLEYNLPNGLYGVLRRKGEDKSSEPITLKAEHVQAIKARMSEIIAGDFPIVKTKTLNSQACEIFKGNGQLQKSRLVSNMEKFFGASIDVPVSIDVVDERKLKKKIGVPLGTRDGQSMLILGVAINQKKKYSIVLENGAPRISLIATFAHELTHIWQYTHWDDKKGFKKCSKGKRLLVYEGMAKWAEIQYLYLIGETAVAQREEMITRARQDEYGIGFCIYEDRYPLSREAMACEDTPFTPNNYPL